MNPEPLLTPVELAAILRVPVQTLHYWSHRGTGPQARRVGRHLRYVRADVDRWLDEQAVRVTAGAA
jgi:excisionase family DNA binding protein